MSKRPLKVKGPLDDAYERIDELASNLVYSLSSSTRIFEVIDEIDERVSLEDLKEKCPDLYKMIVYSAKIAIVEKAYPF
jgi:hypothetical protein